MASEVLVPSSAAEAVELYGDGAATTVIGGGTVVVPDLTYGSTRSACCCSHMPASTALPLTATR
jgi:CO/xanthine dehydrogenase FAD-binding subunit